MEVEKRYSNNVCEPCQRYDECLQQGEEPDYRIVMAVAMHHRMSKFLANEEGFCPSTREASVSRDPIQVLEKNL